MTALAGKRPPSTSGRTDSTTTRSRSPDRSDAVVSGPRTPSRMTLGRSRSARGSAGVGPRLTAVLTTSPSVLALRSVYLGFLQPSGVINVHGLPLAVGVQRCLPSLAMTVAGTPGAPKRQLHLGADRPCIDIDDSSGHRSEERRVG